MKHVYGPGGVKDAVQGEPTPTPSGPQPGMYGLVRTGGILGLLIRLGTKSQVNHVFIVGFEGTIIEARPRGVSLAKIDKYDGRLVIYNDQEPLTPEQANDIVESALVMAKVGTKYNLLDIGVLALTCFGIRWKWAAKRVERKDRLICSQMVDRCYLNAGVHMFNDGRLSGSVSPGDILLRTAMHAWSL